MLFPESLFDKNIRPLASWNHLIFNNIYVVNGGLIKFFLLF